MSRNAIAKKGPPKKDKQQAASLARRMAGKKAQTTQLQVEVNNEEDWEKLLAREGLIVVDVYSEWSGPCVGMIGNLRRAKVEIGGDVLHLAIAKSDEIEALARFRNKSEPTWLFIAGGQLVTMTFGANAPKLMKMIETEVKQEMRVVRGETWRHTVPLSELCDEEKERLEAAEKLRSEADKLEAERIFREKEEKRLKVYNKIADFLCYETIAICFPHTIDPGIGCVMSTDLDSFWRSQKVYVASHHKEIISREILDEINFRGTFDLNEDFLEDIASGPSLVLLLKSQIIASPGQEGEKLKGDIEKQICESLNMVTIDPGQELVEPNASSLPAKYPYVKKKKIEIITNEEEEETEEEMVEEVTSVPGCWTPASYLTKCAALRYLFPARAEKVMTPEESVMPPKIVIAFDVAKQKECFELIEEYPDDVLNVGYFSGTDPATAEPLCANPEQYAMIEHNDNDRVVIVLKKVKSDPLLSFAGLGAAYVSVDEEAGGKEADSFFPPGVKLKYAKLERAQAAFEEEDLEEELGEEEEEIQAESVEQDEDDLMALLGMTID